MPGAPRVVIHHKLVDCILAGDRAAAEEFVNALRPRLLNWFMWLLRNRETAEDLTQETFVELLCALPAFRRESSVETWAFGFARNIHQRYLRRRQEEERGTTSMLVKSGEAEVTVREAMDRIALRWDLADALAQLTELDRQAVVLVKAEGLNSKEVAAILGISEGAVRWHVMEGLNKMRRFLERQEDDFEPAVCSS